MPFSNPFAIGSQPQTSTLANPTNLFFPFNPTNLFFPFNPTNLFFPFNPKAGKGRVAGEGTGRGEGRRPNTGGEFPNRGR